MGRTPTNVTTAALVASVQTQEAVKILVGRDDLVAVASAGWTFVGETLETFKVTYEEDPDCLAHDFFEDVIDLRTECKSPREALVAAQRHRPDSHWEAMAFEDELVTSVTCPECSSTKQLNKFHSALGPGDGECDVCHVPATVAAMTTATLEDPLLDMSFLDLGFPLDDILTLWGSVDECHLLISSGGRLE
jgi:adenylyltransferase/sulfurtransferase